MKNMQCPENGFKAFNILEYSQVEIILT